MHDLINHLSAHEYHVLRLPALSVGHWAKAHEVISWSCYKDRPFSSRCSWELKVRGYVLIECANERNAESLVDKPASRIDDSKSWALHELNGGFEKINCLSSHNAVCLSDSELGLGRVRSMPRVYVDGVPHVVSIDTIQSDLERWSSE